MDKKQIEVRCSHIRYFTSSLTFLLAALEGVRAESKTEGFGAAAFLCKEIDECVEQFELDLIKEKGTADE